MNIKNRNFTLTSVFIFLILSNVQVIAGVRSMGTEIAVDNDSYIQVSVQCATQNESILLRKHVSGKEWCDQQLGEVCGTRKMAVAQKICGRQYLSALKKKTLKRRLKKYDSVNTSHVMALVKKSSEKPLASSDNLKKEKLEIEQKLLEIEGLRLDLRRREIALRKSQMPPTINTYELVSADK